MVSHFRDLPGRKRQGVHVALPEIDLLETLTHWHATLFTWGMAGIFLHCLLLIELTTRWQSTPPDMTAVLVVVMARMSCVCCVLTRLRTHVTWSPAPVIRSNVNNVGWTPALYATVPSLFTATQRMSLSGVPNDLMRIPLFPFQKQVLPLESPLTIVKSLEINQ